ncbi:MAG: flagellar biosynthetic protein FliR [Woeseia sp.]|nr:flagellar biosynthetic protein FliR [Woeseia sp.]MBT8096503.1 flagellar biosynthetic protein FliR [Woeseia sp.]NNL53742.1 flagellar biosynthetic protein FliR [Woeseia sp.]
MDLNLAIGPLLESFGNYLWPFVRVAAFVMVMPVIGGSFVPAPVRLLLAVTLTVVMAPLLPQTIAVQPLSLAGLITVMQELLIGVAMGFAVQVIFDAIALGGQVIAMSMGLGFAVFLDSARGVNIPVLGQFFLMLGMLIFLSLDGHLAMIAMLADSFQLLPIAGPGLTSAAVAELLAWTSQIFIVAMKIALPAITALLVVNLSFGVMSRAAPTLNLFAVGFPIAMLLGFVVIFLNMGSLTENVSRSSSAALEMLPVLLNAR